MNKVQANVYVLANEGNDNLGSKYSQHKNRGFSSKSHEEIFPPSSVQHSNPHNCNDHVEMAAPIDLS